MHLQYYLKDTMYDQCMTMANTVSSLLGNHKRTYDRPCPHSTITYSARELGADPNLNFLSIAWLILFTLDRNHLNNVWFQITELLLDQVLPIESASKIFVRFINRIKDLVSRVKDF